MKQLISFDFWQKLGKALMVKSLPKRSLGVYKQKGLTAFARETGKTE